MPIPKGSAVKQVVPVITGTVLVGSPAINEQEVVQLIQPGIAGCTYKLRAYATDSTGQRHGISAHVKVVNG